MAQTERHHVSDLIPSDEDEETGVMLDITTEQADGLQGYIWKIRGLMYLDHWDVFLAKDAAEEDANASVHPVPGRFVAAIKVAPQWFDRTADEKRNDIVHELIHLVHRDQTETIRVALQDSGYLPPRAFRLLWGSFAGHTEGMVDHLTSVIAPTMPECPV